MTPLLASSPIQVFAHALGWTLLHFLWQGTLIALVLACILALLGDRAPQPRYLASCCALLLMTALPVVTFMRLITAANSTGPAFTLSFEANAALNGFGGNGLSQPLLQRIAQTLDHAMPTVLTLWMLGVALLFVRLALGLIMARRMKSATTLPPPSELLAAFQKIAHRIQVSRPVQLLQSTLVQVPTVIGWLRPVVLIPMGCLVGLSTTQVEAILAHELAHIRRHDYLISVLQSIVEALLFYHPAVWWVSQSIRREREHCCDDLAVQIVGNPLTYARALSLLEEHRSTLPTLALGANGGTLTMRIKRLLGTQQNPAISQLAALALFGIVLLGTALCVTTAARAQANIQTSHALPGNAAVRILTEDIHGPALPNDNARIASPAQQAPTNSKISTEYQNWIDQDVRWNITPQERAAFLQLPTDEERDHFIEQFWQRRNPAGAAPFAARDEHYSRIAYANQHFAAGVAGWQTDRGHVYIVYGAPDTIDSHPATDGSTHTYETWRYTTAPGLGQNITLKFIDICNCGNYQLERPTPQSQLSSPTRKTIRPVAFSGSTSGFVKSGDNWVGSISNVAPTAAPAADPAHKVPAGIMAGQILSRVMPIYPPDAKADRIEGAVILNATISTTGTVENLTVASGPERLRASAIDAVKQWKYKPYLLNGVPTEVDTTITINYSLENPKPTPPQANNDEPINPALTPSSPRKIGNGVSAPVVLSTATPSYTPQAREAKTSGSVLLALQVDPTGLPSHIRVLHGIGNGLDEKAIEAVKQYKFKPAMEAGQPVPVELKLEVNFHIF